MGQVQAFLWENPETPVLPVVQPCTICDACPHLIAGRCASLGPGSEWSVRRLDQKVVDWLGLRETKVRPYSQILERIRERLRPEHLESLCAGCEWLPLGYCREGLGALLGSGRLPPGRV